MVDDLLAIAKCGLESTKLNLVINNKIEMKKLRLHTPNENGKSKCHILHIGKKSNMCPKLKVHGSPMEKVTSDTYLGDIVASDGKNKTNIENRVSKGLGLVSQIMDLLKSVSFGSFYFEMAALLRESILVNGILTNSEVWYNLTKNEIKQLEDVDKLLLRQVFSVPSSCPIEALYLELGCMPLEFIIKTRRINYLHYLVSRDKNEMLFKFFITQWNYPASRNEWTEQVRKDLKDFDLIEDLEWIKTKSKLTFKTLVKIKAREIAFTYLNNKKATHSKLKNLFYVELEIQQYLKDKKITRKQAHILFRFRTRMANYWDNFKGSQYNPVCPVCNDANSVDTQQHSFQCNVLAQYVEVNGKYEDIFYSKVDNKLAETVENITKLRENYIEK